MASISKIINMIEKFAPLDLQETWDNSGWQIKTSIDTVKMVMLAVSPTLDIVKQAINSNCSLIITHHPLIFNKISNITPNNATNRVISLAIKNNIQIYSAHTNLDVAKGGVRDVLAGLFKLKNVKTVEKYVSVGDLETPKSLDEFITEVKKTLDSDYVKLINPANISTVKRVAVCGGSGGDFINNLDNIDVYITSDINYHKSLEVKNFAVIDAGHLETEKSVLPTIKALLLKNDCGIIIGQEKNIVKIC